MYAKRARTLGEHAGPAPVACDVGPGVDAGDTTGGIDEVAEAALLEAEVETLLGSLANLSLPLLEQAISLDLARSRSVVSSGPALPSLD